MISALNSKYQYRHFGADIVGSYYILNIKFVQYILNQKYILDFNLIATQPSDTNESVYKFYI